MKGIMSIIEVMITGVILFVAFLHFFPQYVIRSRWDSILLQVKVRDTLNTIDRLNKTYELATNPDKFQEFMNSTFFPERTGGVVVWWKDVEGLDVPEEPIPYFTKGYKESIVDVVNTTTGYKVYSFTLGLGYPF
jgi:hypothetical protein